MSATLLLVLLETGGVHTAVHFPSYTECVEYMHDAVDRSGVDALYFETKEAYRIGKYVLYCE